MHYFRTATTLVALIFVFETHTSTANVKPPHYNPPPTNPYPPYPPPPKECSIVCTAQYDPVCCDNTTVLRTFGNKCEMYRANKCEVSGYSKPWKLVIPGECCPVPIIRPPIGPIFS